MTGLEFIDFYSQTRHEGGCLLWDGWVGSDGYGRFVYRGKPRLAHRLAVEIGLPGGIPDGKWVLHRESCDKRCVNTNHLTIGTPSENAISAWLAGKQNQPKLGTEAVRQLEVLIARGVPVRLATRAFGVHRNYLSDRKHKASVRAKHVVGHQEAV